MKPRILVFALLAAFGSGCTSMDKPGAALRMEPIMAVRHGGPDAPSYYQLGRYHQGQKRLELAERAYLRAIAADPRNVDAFNALGSLYAERGELERSANLFERAAAIAPDAAYVHNNLGYAYYLQGHFDKAYLAVSKALGLDRTLERGWVNLERIAAASAASTLVEAARLRRLDALPSKLTSHAIHDAPQAAPEPPPIARSPSSKLNLALAQPTPTEDPGSASARQAPTGSDKPASTTNPAPPAAAIASQNGDRIFGGKFVLVSAEREVVPNGGTVEILAEKSAARHPVEGLQPSLDSIRIEVSNGNGITGFARKIGSQLRSNRLLVTRITNHASFSLEQTEIQFEAGHEDAARALASRFNLTGRFMPSPHTRPGTDIRIVLGRDAIQPGWLANASGMGNDGQNPARRREHTL